MQLLGASAVSRPEFISLSILVKPDQNDVSAAPMGEPMLVASPLATLSNNSVISALKELHTHLTCVVKATSSLSNVAKEDRVAIELLQSDAKLLSTVQVFRPLAANGVGLHYKLIQDDGPLLSTVASLVATSGKFEKSNVQGVLICVGFSGLAISHPSPSIQYTIAQRINDCLAIIVKIGASDIAAVKNLLNSFLALDDNIKGSNENLEAQHSLILPEVQDIKGVMSPIRKNRKTIAGNQSGTDVILQMEPSSTAAHARSMIDRLNILSVAESDTFLKKFESSGQERKANLDLTGGAKSRFRKRKDATAADFDNFDYKGPAREIRDTVMISEAFSHNLLTPVVPVQDSAATPGKGSVPLKVPKKDSKTKTGSVPALSANRTDTAAPRTKRNNRLTLDYNNRPNFDDETTTVAQSILSDGHSIASHSRMQVNIALNEDLTCSYKDSQLSTCLVEGVLQIQVKPITRSLVPFHLFVRDPSMHIEAIQENRKFCEDASHELVPDNDTDYADRKILIKIPKPETYFPVLRYKCSSDLRPVPMRVQTRVKPDGRACRVALQISSNPNNSASLTDLTIIMNVPDVVLGESLMTQPAGGVWDESKKCVIWCVSELGGGEKFQLQARFDMRSRKVSAEDLSFPVMVRCQCLFAQLSDIELEVSDIPDHFPAEMTMKVARRFRLSHRERS